MRNYWVLLMTLVCVSTGCGQEKCAVEDRDGTYLATSKIVSGNCGEIPASLVVMADGEVITSTGCTEDYSRVSDDQCTATRSVTCTDNENRTKSTAVGQVTTEAGGDRATAVIDMQIRNLLTMELVCRGVYDVTYVRQ